MEPTLCSHCALDQDTPEVVRAINSTLLQRVIGLGDLESIMAGFAALGFPNCRKVIDGIHLPIRAPEHRVAQYINCKSYFSMVMQGLVDYRGQFTGIFVGWSGRAYDAWIFQNSSLHGKLEVGTFVPNCKVTAGEVQMPLCIMGDAA